MTFNIKIIIAKGAIQFSNNTVESINIGIPPISKDIEMPEEDTEKPATDLQKAFIAIEILVKKKRLIKMRDFFAPYKIIKERYLHSLKPSDYCTLLRENTNIPVELLPKSHNIRSVCCHKTPLYPNWVFEGEEPEFAGYIKDIATEMIQIMDGL